MASVSIIDSNANIGKSFTDINNNFATLQNKLNTLVYEDSVDSDSVTLSEVLQNINTLSAKVDSVYSYINKTIIANTCCTRITPTLVPVPLNTSITVSYINITPYKHNIISLYNFITKQWDIYNIESAINVSLLDENNNTLKTNSLYDVCVCVIDGIISVRFKLYNETNNNRHTQDGVLYYRDSELFLRVIGSIATDIYGTITYSTTKNFNISIYNKYNAVDFVGCFTSKAFLIADDNTYNFTLHTYNDNVLQINNKDVFIVSDVDTVDSNFQSEVSYKFNVGYHAVNLKRIIEPGNFVEIAQILLKI